MKIPSTLIRKHPSLKSFAQKSFFVAYATLTACAAFCSICTPTTHAQDRDKSVINGSDATPGAWPWMVALLSSANKDSTEAHFCGGSLIGPQHILTAAHCVDGALPGDIQVLIGETVLPFAKGNRRDIVGFKMHPDYNNITIEHDFAIIKLKEPVANQPIALASQSDAALYAPGTTATILGWGMTDPKLPILPTKLQQGQIPIASDTTCLSEIGRYFKPDSMLCAGTKSSSSTSADGVDSCYGDSGGPLVVPDGVGGYKLTGVVSWGLGCASNKTRGVYAEVPAHSNFVSSFPDIAPLASTAPTITGTAAAQQTITCVPGTYAGDPVSSYSFIWYSLVNGTPTAIAGATASTLLLSDSLVGSLVECSVAASNNGGTSGVSFSDPVTIQTKIDTTPPTATISSLTCKSSHCSVSITATDDSSGVAEVSAVAEVSYKGKCGKKKSCSSTQAKPVSVNQDDAQTWTGAFRISRRFAQSVKVTVSVKDRNGNANDAAAVGTKRL